MFPRPELMAVSENSGIPLKFSNIIRGLMEHAGYRVKNSKGHSNDWFNMSLGSRGDVQLHPSRFLFIILSSCKIWSRLLENPGESVRVGFSSEEFSDLPLTRENQPAKKVRWARMVESTSKSVDLSCLQMTPQAYAEDRTCSIAKNC